MSELEILKLEKLNLLVIKLISGRYFTSTPDSIIISVPNLANLIKYLVKSGLISVKVIEGILSEVQE